MAILLFANNATATLQNAIGSGATSIALAPGTGSRFPSPSAGQYFLGTLVDAATGLLNEIVQVTARSGDTLTVVRAQEGTAAQNWNSGDFFNNFWTAGSASAMLQQGQYQQQAANYAVDTGSVNAMAVTLSPAPISMTTLVGAPVRVKVSVTNTAATPTLNVNGLGAFNCNVVNSAGVQPLGIGTAAATEILEFIWDGTQFQYHGRVAAASTAQILAGTDNVQPITSLGLRNGEPSVLTSTAGYKVFADGLIIQWGQVTTASGTGEDFFLPTTFPTAQVSVVGSSNLSPSSWLVLVVIYPTAGTPLTKIHVNAGQFNFTGSPPNPVAGALIRFISIGY